MLSHSCSVPRLSGSYRLQAALCVWEVMYHGPAPEEGPVCYRRSESRYGDFCHPISPSYVVSWNLEYLTPPCTPELMHHPAVCSALLPLLPFFSFCWSLYPGADSSSACDPVSVLLMQSLFGLWRRFYSTREKEKGERKKVRKWNNCRVKPPPLAQTDDVIIYIKVSSLHGLPRDLPTKSVTAVG